MTAGGGSLKATHCYCRMIEKEGSLSSSLSDSKIQKAARF